MSIHRILNPLHYTMYIELGEGGHIKRLEKFKNAKFDQDVIIYDNEFIRDVIGSRKEMCESS